MLHKYYDMIRLRRGLRAYLECLYFKAKGTDAWEMKQFAQGQ